MKQIKDFPMYYVTKDGRVFSKYSNRYLKPMLRSEYHKVTLVNETVKKQLYIHRLVLSTFINNPCDLPCINHIDGCKLNNNLDNLEWCTYSHNNKHAHSLGLNSSIHCIKSVALFDKSMRFIKLYNTMSDASIDSFHITGISDCCNGKRTYYKDHIWKFLPSNNLATP